MIPSLDGGHSHLVPQRKAKRRMLGAGRGDLHASDVTNVISTDRPRLCPFFGGKLMFGVLKQHWVVLVLALLLLAQLAALGIRQAAGTTTGGVWLGVGDSLHGVPVVDASGREARLAFGDTALVLVFNSECGHCERVAPMWQGWLDTHRAAVRVVAISSESSGVAEAYVARHGWEVDLWTVDSTRRGGAAHALTGRTPWLFLIDGDGVILAEGHGEGIDQLVASALGWTAHEGAGDGAGT